MLLENNIGIEDVIRMDLFAVSMFAFIGRRNSNSIHSEEMSKGDEGDEEGEDEGSAEEGNSFAVEGYDEEDEGDDEEDEGDEEEEE